MFVYVITVIFFIVSYYHISNMLDKYILTSSIKNLNFSVKIAFLKIFIEI